MLHCPAFKSGCNRLNFWLREIMADGVLTAFNPSALSKPAVCKALCSHLYNFVRAVLKGPPLLGFFTPSCGSQSCARSKTWPPPWIARAHLSSTTTKTRNARWNAAFTRQDRQNSEYLPPKGGVPVVLPHCLTVGLKSSIGCLPHRADPAEFSP